MAKSRKRKIGKREPNGRLSRKKTDTASRFVDGLGREELDVIGVGLSARIRVHHVKPEHSRDQMAGSFVGRLCLQGLITSQQYDAAQTYAQDTQAYRAAVSAPKQPGAVDLNAARGGVGDYDPVAFVLRAKAKMDGDLQSDGITRRGGIRRAIQEKQNELRGTANLWGALSLIVVEDRHLPNLVGDLRHALNALAKHYGLTSLTEIAA